MRFSKFFLGCTLAAATALTVWAAGPETFKVSELTFKRPAAWEWIETTSSMRAAQLKVPSANGAGEVVFYYFGSGNGGGTQANVSRWISQFGPQEELKPKVEETTVGTTKVTYVHVEGTYASGMPGGPKTPMPNYALQGAIVEGGQGSIFVKFTGPKDLVNGAVADFKAMVESPLK